MVRALRAVDFLSTYRLPEHSASATYYRARLAGEYLAWAVPSRGQESSCVDVVYLPQLSARALRLSASLQHKEVTALAVGQGYVGSSDPSSVNPTQPEALLVAASPEAVVLWRLAQAYEAAASRQPLPEPLLVLERPGQVDAACLSSPGGANLLALCAGLQVHVFELAGLTHSFLLEGHGAPVRAATFCEPHRPLWLLTAGEDRSFKLWDLQQGSLVYQNGAAALALLWGTPAAAAATITAAAASAGAAAAAVAAEAEADAVVLAACGTAPQSPILTAYALTSLAVDPTFLRVAVGAADGVVRVFDLATLPACRCVQVGTMSALAVIDSHTGEVVQAHFLRGGLPQLSLLLPGPSQGPAAPPGPPRAAELLSDVSVAGAYALGLPRHQRFMYCCMAAAYSSDITILSLRPLTPTTAAAAAAAGGAGLGSGGGGGAAGVRAKARGGGGGAGSTVPARAS
ncbi:hypothetical protein QJQ45_018714 [Haematococcus lacustris]|nr:hypothetical protein QJQ45_018714 [Haematococcus lacustris]